MGYTRFKTHFVISILLLLLSHSVLANELIMSAAPRESVASGHKLYDPIAAYMSKILGVKVTYKHPRHWLRYQSDIKKQNYDIVLDGPHLASWRIKHIGHTALIKLPGTLAFHIITKADNKAANKPEDLVYKKVCAIAPPNLTSVILLQRLNDPVREPVINSVKGGMKGIYKNLMSGSCVAAVVRTDFYNKKLSDEQKKGIKILYTSPDFPNQVITTSNKISADDRQALITAFTQGDGVNTMAPVVKRFAGKDVPAFIPVAEGEYNGYYTFLKGVVLGW